MVSIVQKGDIIHEDYGFFGITGHSGIVEGTFYDVKHKKFYIRIIEAISSGVSRSVLDFDRIPARGARIYRVTSATSKEKSKAVEFCKSQLGKPYAVKPSKFATSTQTSWYCSELVWAAYIVSNFTINLDSNDGNVVLPNDIKASKLLTQIHSSEYAKSLSANLTDAKSHWAWNQIKYSTDNGLLLGTSSTQFAPDSLLTRAMMITIMHRLEGKPYSNSWSMSPFIDVPTNSFYEEAVLWGKAKQIITGVYKHVFAANNTITRQDMVTILYRYARSKGYNTTYSNTVLNKFTDKGKVSDYALDPVKWAISKGLINGRTNTTIVPTGMATRAEFAVILKRFIDNCVK